MVTQSGREKLILDAVRDFENQRYVNKELVIVHDESEEFDNWLHTVTPDAHIYGLDRSFPTLGWLRNLAATYATGDVLCQWDDDDRYHPDRLEQQLAALNNNVAVFLANQFVYFMDRRSVHLRMTGSRGIEGTVLYRNGLNIRYPEIGKGEDTLFMAELKRRKTTTLQNLPGLYLRQYHGRNTWDHQHFVNLVPRVNNRDIKLKLKEHKIMLGYYELPSQTNIVNGTATYAIA
jgi:glycosyltransferase involved in cell wall biosynthesis